jgi:hypothetical protein
MEGEENHPFQKSIRTTEYYNIPTRTSFFFSFFRNKGAESDQSVYSCAEQELLRAI